jgi:dipeptidase E
MLGGGRVALIPNALDARDLDVRSERVEADLTLLRDLGCQPQILDLHNFVDDQAGVTKALRAVTGLWVRGGNTFVLNHALQSAGASLAIRAALNRDDLVYGGESAGAIVLSADLRPVALVDDPDAVTTLYREDPSFEGLGIVRHVIIPHFSPSGASPGVDVVVKYCRDHHLQYHTIQDGAVLTYAQQRWQSHPAKV